MKLPFAGLSFWLRRVLLELVARKADWGMPAGGPPPTCRSPARAWSTCMQAHTH